MPEPKCSLTLREEFLARMAARKQERTVRSMRSQVSNCCRAMVRVAGSVTLSYECTSCGKACDAVEAAR